LTPPWRETGDGVSVTVRVTPRAHQDKIEGVRRLSNGQAILAVRVRALPQDGAANDAVVRILAKACGIPASAARVEAGAGARVKTILLRGDSASLLAAMAALPED